MVQQGKVARTLAVGANALHIKLNRLIGNEYSVRDRIQIYALNELGGDLYTSAFGPPTLASTAEIQTLLRESAATIPGYSFSDHFLLGEWSEVVNAWQFTTWEAYRDVQRLGRRTRIGGKQREVLWAIFQARLADALPAGSYPPRVN